MPHLTNAVYNYIIPIHYKSGSYVH